ncbi:MAG: hypothetical protein CBC12_07445 [Candidatus Puniceispirillum sp. TMED52]|jgi:hypothetical protein|nr:MAG: hypothetical protein CBC12_07445 [Candidatus Puniceispirillum sp. TMED52]
MPFLLPESIIPPLDVHEGETTPPPKTVVSHSDPPPAPKKTSRSKKEEIVVTLEEAADSTPRLPEESDHTVPCCPAKSPCETACCPDVSACESACCPAKSPCETPCETPCTENEPVDDEHDSGRVKVTADTEEGPKQEQLSAEELERTKTLKQLRDMCNEMGLSCTGKKGDLARRISA